MTVQPTDPFVQPAWISPITCAPWCTDQDGHASQLQRADQTCWGTGYYVDLSIEEVNAYDRNQNANGQEADWVISVPRIGPCGYRAFNELPLVYLHLELPGAGDNGLDTSCKMTAEEARLIARHLIAVADEIEGAK